MRRLSRRNNNNNIISRSRSSDNSNSFDRVKVLAMGLRRVSPSVGNARWRGIERGRTTFIIRVGNSRVCPTLLPCVMSDCSISFAACHYSSPFFLLFNELLVSLSLTLRRQSRTSFSLFLGIALYIITCLEPHRRTTRVPSTVLVSFLSCHYSPFLPPRLT
jgi:hypothetical protein